ncbi:MAG: poly-beta,6-N-acetyl-D-glucosamine synthase, partial [Actinomycetota bacterium]|nr:poly-beta,6-N-acetyl-D-glucosamine synthase [Actinomycetota bacterium]
MDDEELTGSARAEAPAPQVPRSGDPAPSANGHADVPTNGHRNGHQPAGQNGHQPRPAVDLLTAVLVPTHNDGGNIGDLLRRLLAEPTVGEVLVVASGCDDDTVPIVAEAAAGDPRVQLFVEADRTGKANAINFGLTHLGLPYVVIVSGDVMPEPGAIGLLLTALQEPGVGLAGGRPVPVNPESSPMGHAVHLLWRLHHRLALHQPKLGEMLALRAEAV